MVGVGEGVAVASGDGVAAGTVAAGEALGLGRLVAGGAVGGAVGDGAGVLEQADSARTATRQAARANRLGKRNPRTDDG